jgi:outer membrane protein assembly factor BamB
MNTSASSIIRRFLPLAAVLVCGLFAYAQTRGGNWPTYGGDAQRSGWEGTDAMISRDSVKDLRLLWKMKLDAQPRGTQPVTPPVILGRLISYRGFKELAFVGVNSDIVYAIDADLGSMFWQRHLEYSSREGQVSSSSASCPGGLTAMPTMPVPARGAAGRGGPPPGGAPRGGAFLAGLPSVYALASDGRLHRLNTSTGDDMTQPVSVLPPNARATSLSMLDGVIYTVTSHDCNDAPNAVWAIDLSSDAPKVRSFELKAGGKAGLGGPAIGSDGTVYVQAESLMAFTPKDLQLKDSFTTAPAEVSPASSPVVFSYENRDFIAAACGEGRLCLLEKAAVVIFGDAAAPGGLDRLLPLYRTPPIVQSSSNGISGSLSSWQDADGTRWVLASVIGPPHPDLKVASTEGRVLNGFIVAFKVQQNDGRITLEPAWISRDLNSPLPPVIANGVVFALSAGEFARDGRPKASSHATLYALDARTGKELYSSRNLVTVPAALTGLTVSNGRVYFGGLDGSLYAFGMFMEH